MLANQALQSTTSGSDADSAAGVGGSIASGATAGFMFGGPTGAAVGAGAGALAGVLGARAARKSRERQAKAAHLERRARIEQTRGAGEQQALSNMAEALRSAFGVGQ